MKKILALILALSPLSAAADTYQVTFGWQDPTTYLADEVPTYEATVRVSGAAGDVDTPITGLATPGGSTTVTANPGEEIGVSARACNGALCSTWTQWVTAAAPYPPTVPSDQIGLSITVTRVGP